MIQEKQITISSLSQKNIAAPQGAKWKDFIVYQATGNDGNVYETTDYNYYKELRMGQSILMKFTVESKNVRGRIYTSYKIVTGNEKPKESDKILEVINTRFDRIESLIGKLGVKVPAVDQDIDIEPTF